jgi:arylsulfatase A-like enzyme
MPLTYSLLAMAGDGIELRSSIAPYVSLTTLLTIIGSPVLYLALTRVLLRAKWVSLRRVQAALLVLLAVYLPIGAYGYERWYAGGPYEGLARSPHWAIISSWVSHLRGDLALDLRDTGPASYRADFLTAGEDGNRPTQAPRSPAVKNVIVVVLESTGTQFLGTYGGAYATTPCLESEARNSLKFSNFYSNAGYTLHSMMPLVVSQYPGTGWEIYSATHPHLPATSAAQALHERGYRTAFLTGGSLDFRGSRHFFEGRGFDLVRGFEDFRQAGVGTPVSSWGMDDPSLFDGLFNWIGEDSFKPFFTIVWTQQTHHPYTMAPGQHPIEFMDGKSDDASRMLNLYLNDLRIADEQLGRLFGFLRSHGLDQSTLVVITGDHGEAFGFPHPWMFHGTALYQESVNVPCIFWSPTLFTPGTRSDAIGAHVDLNPTLFDVLGFPAPPDWQGISLFDPGRPQRAYFSCNTGNLLEGLRDGHEKYIYNLTLGREELYDLDADPAEQINIAARLPDRCHEYRQRLSAWTKFERDHLKALTAADPSRR